MNRQTRRAFLAAAGAVSLAGCVDSLDFASNSVAGESGNSTNSSEQSNKSKDSETDGGPKTDLPGTQIDGFEDFERWFVLSEQGKLTATANDSYAGSQSAHLKATPSHNFAGMYKAFTEPKDFTGKNFSVAIKLKEPRISKVSLALLAPDRGNMVRMTRTLTGPTDRWIRIDFGTTTVKRNPDLSKVQEIRLIGRRRGNDGSPIEMEFDDLRTVDKPKKGKVMLTFDDSHLSHYNRAFPAMREYDFPGVEGVIAESIYGTNRLDVGMMREMRDAGWDMASHPLTRGEWLSSFSPKKQEKRIKENKQFLERKGFPDGARHFITPQNMRGSNTQDLVEKHHDTMFTFGGMPGGLPPTTQYNYSRVNASNFQGLKRFIDFSEAHKQLLVINHHAIGANGISLDQFERELEYIDQASVDVVTASDMLDNSK